MKELLIIRRWKQCLPTAISLVILLYAFYFSAKKIPLIGGPDFFFYLLNARDLAWGINSPSFGYFPGVIWIWEALIRVVGTNLNIIQLFYFVILSAGAVAVAGNVYFPTRNTAMSVCSAILYLAGLHMLEGFQGVLEPFAVLAFLVGTLTYQYLEAKEHYRSALLALGFFMGISLIMKQQSVIFFIATLILMHGKNRNFWSIKINQIVPAAIGIAFFVILITSFGSLSDLTKGLELVKTYPSRGEFFSHVIFFGQRILPIVLFAFTMCLILIALRIRASSVVTNKSFRAVLFWFACSLLFLIQFRTRGYLHYGLYILPCVIIGSIITFDMIIKSLSSRLPIGGHFLAPILTTIALIFWPNLDNEAKSTEAHEVFQQLTQMPDICSHFEQSQILTIPTKANTLHWICNTSSADNKWGYSWAEESVEYYRSLVAHKAAKEIFLFNGEVGQFEADLLNREEWQRLPAQIESNGYKTEYQHKYGTLYRIKEAQ